VLRFEGNLTEAWIAGHPAEISKSTAREPLDSWLSLSAVRTS
jgi:hypothetical protein